MTPQEKAAHHIGPGGYKCPCCGPSPKDRKKHRRIIRRRMKAEFRQAVRKILKDLEQD